ncbi:MAG: 30S ribosomal protein S4 [Spirochaetales bacterium]|nr:30S ribosomal protein S4 [Spirochaetales bacterium]
MGRYLGPKCRLCRTEKVQLFLKGERCKSSKCPITKKKGPPGKGLRYRMRKLSDYGIQLREKQKLKRIYRLLEQQFINYFYKAVNLKGVTGENLIRMLERRLDNIIYRMRFSSSRDQARQLIRHGHVKVNGKKVDIPSFSVKVDDKIEVKEKSKMTLVVKESLKEYSRSGVVPWLEVDPDNVVGIVKGIPNRNDITDLADIKEQLIVELYSK